MTHLTAVFASVIIGVTMQLRTHRVVNQPPEFTDVNIFDIDKPLAAAVLREGGGDHLQLLSEFGSRLSRADTWHHGRDANRYPPELLRFDRFGHRGGASVQ